MLTLDLDDFMFELKDGAIKHVGPSNRTATAKLYDVEGVDVREYGDKRVKIGFTDEDGSGDRGGPLPRTGPGDRPRRGDAGEDSPVFE